MSVRIRFVREYENLSFPDAVRKLADRAGIPIQEDVPDAKEEARRRGRSDLMRLQNAAAEWFHYLLFKKPVAQAARDYLKQRGIGMETARAWKLGYAPEEQPPFFDWARANGFSTRLLVAGGLAKWRDENRPERGAYSFFRHRLMFPVNNESGEPIAFSGRVLSKDQKGGKYVNSPETPVFDKSRTFYGLDRSKRPILRQKRVLVFEGQLDLITAHESGIDNAVAPLGTAFTAHHARILRRFTEEAVLCYDSDNAGLIAARRTFRELAPAGLLVRLAILPEGEDPDSCIRKFGAEAFGQIVEKAREFFDFHIDRQDSGLAQGNLRDRLQFARELATDVALVEEKMMQDSLINRIATRLGVGEDEIRKLVADAHRTQQRQTQASRRRNSRGLRKNSAREEEAPAEPTVIANRTIRLLCQALLACADTRAALTAEPPPPYLESLPDTELLARIWTSNVNPASAASVNAFLHTLSPSDRSCIENLLREQSPRPNPRLATEYLRSLHRQSIESRIRETEAKLGTPGLHATEVERSGKLLLDLRKRLHDIASPA